MQAPLAGSVSGDSQEFADYYFDKNTTELRTSEGGRHRPYRHHGPYEPIQDQCGKEDVEAGLSWAWLRLPTAATADI